DLVDIDSSPTRRSSDLAVDIAAGRFDRIAHPRLRREMDDDLRRGRGCGAIARGPVLEHAGDVPVAGILRKLRKPGVFELHVVIVGKAVEAGDTVTVIEEPAGEVIPDEASSAGDQKLHDRPPVCRPWHHKVHESFLNGRRDATGAVV